MNKLQKIRWIASPQWQRERLSKWLQEWRIDQELREPPGEALPIRSDSGWGDEAIGDQERREWVTAFENEPPPTPGQVRLVSAEFFRKDDRPLYIAILSEWEQGMLLIAPFSRFAEPATTGELKLDRPDGPLQVLSLWNAHSVDEAPLKRSWLVDQLSDEERDHAWNILQHITTGATVSADLAMRCGPPVSHPEDPRIDYQEQEIELVAFLADAERSQAEPQNLIPFPVEIRDAYEKSVSAVAADSAKSDPVSCKWYIPRLQLCLLVSFQGRTGRCSFLVLDQEGEPSLRLDGGQISSKAEKNRAVIEQGQADLAYDQGFCLRDADGNVVEIEALE